MAHRSAANRNRASGKSQAQRAVAVTSRSPEAERSRKKILKGTSRRTGTVRTRRRLFVYSRPGNMRTESRRRRRPTRSRRRTWSLSGTENFAKSRCTASRTTEAHTRTKSTARKSKRKSENQRTYWHPPCRSAATWTSSRDMTLLPVNIISGSPRHLSSGPCPASALTFTIPRRRATGHFQATSCSTARACRAPR